MANSAPLSDLTASPRRVCVDNFNLQRLVPACLAALWRPGRFAHRTVLVAMC
jgi:hypothetical protein